VHSDSTEFICAIQKTYVCIVCMYVCMYVCVCMYVLTRKILKGIVNCKGRKHIADSSLSPNTGNRQNNEKEAVTIV